MLSDTKATYIIIIVKKKKKEVMKKYRKIKIYSSIFANNELRVSKRNKTFYV